LLAQAAKVLRERRDEFAELITLEMGKLAGEARAEIKKCALAATITPSMRPGFSPTS
jgi:succinate-semialdehyde dehydrogenase / glutarate-semialdehyde dehydrogenase